MMKKIGSILLLLVVLGVPIRSHAAQVTLAWDPPISYTTGEYLPPEGIKSYKIYLGFASRSYHTNFDTGSTQCMVTVTGLLMNTTYYLSGTTVGYPINVTGTNPAITNIMTNATVQSTYCNEIVWCYTSNVPGKVTLVMLVGFTLARESVMDNADPAPEVNINGSWTPSVAYPGYYGTNYIHDGNMDKGTKSVQYVPNFPLSGQYEVAMKYVVRNTYATNVPVDIVSMDGTNTFFVNQRVSPGDTGWKVLATNEFAVGTNGWIRIRTTGTSSGHVIADAVRFKKVN